MSVARWLAPPAAGLLGVVVGAPIGAGAWFAGAAAVGLEARVEAWYRPEDTVMVVVAARSLPVGAEIAPDDLYAVQIPPRFLPPGVFLAPELAVGARVTEPIFGNDLLRAERLACPGGPCRTSPGR